MIYGFDVYKEFTNKIFEKVPCMRTEQLKMFFVKYYGMTEDEAWTIILGLQRAENFWLSCDGWAMTKGMYKKFTGDRFKEHVIINEVYRLDKMDHVASKYNPDVIKCLWLVIDSLPQSIDFVITDKPYNIQFVITPENANDEIQSRLYQLVYVSKQNEIVLPQMLKSYPKIQDKQTRDLVRRVALIENEDAAWRIPYIGFSKILLYDENEKSHLKEIKSEDANRDKDIRWQDEDN